MDARTGVGHQRASIGALTVILVAAAIIRWHNIGDYSLWLDEIGELVVASGSLPELVAGVRSHAAAAPLDYVLVHFVTGIIGDQTVQARVWSFGAGVLGVGATALVARLIFRNWGIAILGAVAMALAPFHVFYSQEARFYSSSVFFGLMIIAAFTLASRRNTPWGWTAFGVAVTVGLYDHYFLGFVALAACLATLIAALWLSVTGGDDASVRRRWTAVVGATAASAGALALFSPWLLYSTVHQLAVSNPVLPLPFSIDGWVLAIVTLVSPGRFDTEPVPIAWIATGAVVLLAIVGVAANRPVHRPEIGMLGLLAAFLIPVVWLANEVGGYRFAERQVIILVPVLLLLAAAGGVAVFARLSGAAPFWRQATAIGLAAIVWACVMAMPMINVWDGAWRVKEDWRAAAALVAQNVCPGGRAFVNIGPGYRYGIGFYQPELADRLVQLSANPRHPLPLTVAETATAATDWIVILRDAPNVWAPGVGGLEAISAHLGGRGYSRRDFTERLRVFIPRETCPR